MDLSFSLDTRRRVARWAVSFADLKAEADRRRVAVRTCGTATGTLRGQGSEPDPVHVLACTLAQRDDGTIDAVTLSGSFSPKVAKQLMVGSGT